MLAAIDFGIRTPGFLHVAARLLDRVRHIKPALEMSAAELTFGVFLIARALSHFLDFDFVVGKLLGSGRRGGSSFSYSQRSYPRRCGGGAAGFRSEHFILLKGAGANQITIYLVVLHFVF